MQFSCTYPPKATIDPLVFRLENIYSPFYNLNQNRNEQCPRLLFFSLLFHIYVNWRSIMFIFLPLECRLYLHSNYGMHSFDCFELPRQASASIQFRKSTFCVKINWCQPDYVQSYGIASEVYADDGIALRQSGSDACLCVIFVCGRNIESNTNYVHCMAIDSNRILFHAIADVILWELFIFYSIFFLWHFLFSRIVISVAVTQMCTYREGARGMRLN